MELPCLVRGGEPVVIVDREHQRLVERVPERYHIFSVTSEQFEIDTFPEPTVYKTHIYSVMQSDRNSSKTVTFHNPRDYESQV